MSIILIIFKIKKINIFNTLFVYITIIIMEFNCSVCNYNEIPSYLIDGIDNKTFLDERIKKFNLLLKMFYKVFKR